MSTATIESMPPMPPSTPAGTNVVERRCLDDGRPNPKYVDLCDEDPTIAGQKFVCLSFISPETILKKREVFLFNEFVRQWDMTKSMGKFGEFLNFVSYKYSLNMENVLADYQDFVQEEETRLKADAVHVEDDFKNFMDKHEDRLNAQFSRDHDFQTSVRGIKVRGSFSTQEEAEHNCKKLRERDPAHDIYLGQVGIWMPFEPNAYKTGKVDFLEPELNRLHEEKIKNEAKAKQEFDERVKTAKRKAIEDNIEKARKSGNKLTQAIDDQGNLVGVNTMNFDDREVADPKEQDAHMKSVRDRAPGASSLDASNIV
jgi:hypothetical protein